MPDEENKTSEAGDGRTYKIITLPKCALEQRGVYWRLAMPYSGGYPGYDFYMPSYFVAEGEDAVTVFLPEDYPVTVKRGETKIRIPAAVFADDMENVSAEDFEPPLWDPVALDGEREDETQEGDVVTLRMPGTADGKIYVPRRFVEEKDGKTKVRIPRDYKFRAVEDGKERVVSAEEYRSAQAVENAEKALRQSQSQGSNFLTVFVPAAARIYEGEERSYFKMPEGRYGECGFYLPNSLVGEEDGHIVLHIPAGSNLKLVRDPSAPAVEISPEQFLREFEGKGAESFPAGPISSNPVMDRAKSLDNLPDEMRKTPNWVVVRKARREDGSYSTHFINPVTGKEASSSDPTTWVDYDTALRFAMAAGGHTLAYALDGGVVCLEADEKKRKELLKAFGKSYEESAGEGRIRIFAKNFPEENVSAFSKDGEETFFRKGRFVEITGDRLSETGELADLKDSPSALSYVERTFPKRPQGKMKSSDKEILERAFSGRNGETMRALMKGKIVAGSRERSEQALMDRLAFWCSKDAEQMMRIFYSSGLFDKTKDMSFYENMCAKSRETVSDVYKRPRSVKAVLHSAKSWANGVRQSFAGEQNAR